VSETKVKAIAAYSASIVFTIQIAFIILKLINIINWAWYIVLLPTIIVGCLALCLFILAMFCVMIAAGRSDN